MAGDNMTVLPSGPPCVLLSAARVAELLDCKESWVKEMARQRRIPFTRIAGQYRFSEAHVREIIRIFECPAEPPRALRARPRPAAPASAPVLRSRPPQRRAS